MKPGFSVRMNTQSDSLDSHSTHTKWITKLVWQNNSQRNVQLFARPQNNKDHERTDTKGSVRQNTRNITESHNRTRQHYKNVATSVDVSAHVRCVWLARNACPSPYGDRQWRRCDGRQRVNRKCWSRNAGIGRTVANISVRLMIWMNNCSFDFFDDDFFISRLIIWCEYLTYI